MKLKLDTKNRVYNVKRSKKDTKDKKLPKNSIKKEQKTGNKPSKKPKKNRSFLNKTLRFLIKWGFIAFLWLIIAFGFILFYYAHDLPDISKLYDNKYTPSIEIYDQKGNEIKSSGQLRGDYLSYDELPKPLINAIIATEDKRFFSHPGVDVLGIARAIVTNIARGKFAQGGSTISQQLSKVIFLKPDRTMSRKLKELMLTFWLESKFTKEQILEIYVNRVYLGSGTYGVDAAARRYFGKSAKYLNNYESALIAGLLKAPTSYSPLNNIQKSKDRTRIVLKRMLVEEYITEEEMKNASSDSLAKVLDSKFDKSGQQYFADYVIDELNNYVTNLDASIIVNTTLDKALQSHAEESVTATFFEIPVEKNVEQAALITLDKDGAIKAMVGGLDYSQSQFNRAYQARRHVGSLFKLFIFLAAFEDGFTPNDYVEDKPISVDGWTPKNYTGKYQGMVTLKTAFAKSLNSAAVVLAENIGRRNVVKMAKRFGLSKGLHYNPSISLGTAEVSLMQITGAYNIIANGGFEAKPYAINKITTKGGNLIFKRQNKKRRVTTKTVVSMANEIMLETVENGTGKKANFGQISAGKTGTSQNFNDAWFVGYSGQLTTGVWVGNDNGSGMNKISGGSVPAQIWGKFMGASKGINPEQNIPTQRREEIQGLPWKD